MSNWKLPGGSFCTSLLFFHSPPRWLWCWQSDINWKRSRSPPLEYLWNITSLEYSKVATNPRDFFCQGRPRLIGSQCFSRNAKIPTLDLAKANLSIKDCLSFPSISSSWPSNKNELLWQYWVQYFLSFWHCEDWPQGRPHPRRFLFQLVSLCCLFLCCRNCLCSHSWYPSQGRKLQKQAAPVW